MNWLWSKCSYGVKLFLSYIIAFARLINWTIIFFFVGLQRTLFMKSEVSSVDLHIVPLRCDMERVDQNLAYIDKLCMENPDLAQLAEEDLMDDLDSDNDEDEL